MSESSAKYIGRVRPPRVHIEYEVDIGGATESIELPFVMGVMADLSGDAEKAKGFADRDFLEFDDQSFNQRMEAIRPRATMRVANKLTGEGEMSIDLSFQKMDDFSPAAVARQVDSTRSLLESRNRLATLLSATDGRRKAEALLQQIADAGPDGWKKVLEHLGGGEELGRLLKAGPEAKKE